MGAKPQPCYNRICAIIDRVIKRLQCTCIMLSKCFQKRLASSYNFDEEWVYIGQFNQKDKKTCWVTTLVKLFLFKIIYSFYLVALICFFNSFLLLSE